MSNSDFKQCVYRTGTFERCRRRASEWGSRCWQHQGWTMIYEDAIETVARQLVAEAAKRITWEDISEIGEYDWQEVAECIKYSVAPEPYGWDEAIELLVSRVGVDGGQCE